MNQSFFFQETSQCHMNVFLLSHLGLGNKYVLVQSQDQSSLLNWDLHAEGGPRHDPNLSD